MKQAERNYYSTLVSNAEGNQIKTWKVINEILGRTRKPVSLPKKLKRLEEDGTDDDKQAVGETLNTFFATVGKELADGVPSSILTPESYINNLYERQSIFLKPVTTQEMHIQLMKISTKKSSGPDGLHPRFIKDIAMYISSVLAKIINTSFSSGSVPEQWKIARITPLYKGGNTELPTNYRPISILSTLAKIAEALMYNRLNSYLEKFEILSKDQYGFRKKKSTKGALIRFINQVQSDLDKGKFAVAIFVDLKKAFDTVDHKILLKKLDFYGIRGNANLWFKNYLTDRKQYIDCDSISTKMVQVKVGVPQGSNLGPLLFLLYINDLPLCLKHGKCTMFADDTTLYNSSNNSIDVVRKMNVDLENLNQWIAANKLTLNANKTYACIFGSQNRTANVEPMFLINNIPIKKVGYVRYLGIEVDSRLSWSMHIAKLNNKCNQVLGVLAKTRKFMSRETAKLIYYALIHSRIVYCQEIWGSACQTTLTPLIRTQKKAMRIICRVGRSEHSTPLFQELNIRPLNTEIAYRRALLAYEIIKNPNSHDIHLNVSHSHPHDTRFRTNNVPLPRKRTWGWGTNGIEYLLIQAYNNLPSQLQALPPATVAVYKSRLKPYFLP